jgi:hypothetical protein
MSDPFQGAAPPPGATPPRSTPIGQQYGTPAPPPGYGPPPGHGQSSFGGPPIAQPQWAQPPGQQQRGTNGMAIASFVLGLVWLCAIGSTLAIVFGFIALGQIKRSSQGGRGLAITGIVLGVLGIIATAITVVFVVDRTEDAFEQVPSEVDDVELVSCGEAGSGRPEAVLEVTNDSSKTSSYVIRVEFSASGESTESEFTGVEVLAPGGSITVTVEGSETLPGDARCDITYVQRLANTAGTTGGND